MASVLFSFVVVTLVILYVQKRNIALSYRLIGSTCNETKLLPLTPPMKCVNGRSDETFFYIDCTDLQHFKRGFEWTLNMQLGLPVYNVIRNHTESHDDVWNCVFILQWSGSTVHLENDFHLNFNVRPWMFAGISKYICDTGNASNCAFQVKIRKDILALPPFSFTPDEPEFWNFSSPLFRSEFEWMSSLYLSGSLTDHYPYELPGLSGSSVQKLFVNGNFGTDQRGSLPHLDNLPLLDTLTIFNSTRDLTKEHLTATRNIKYLNLLNIKFLKLPKFIADLKKLQNLTFQSTKNNFTFSPETLLGLHFLEVLNLSGNRIVQWTMPHFRTLRVLYLNYCKMKKFSTNELLLEHSELRELYLRGNALNSLSSEAFFGVQGLWTLDLSYNLINQLPSQIFTPLTNLSRLFLQGNNLTDWPILSCINYKIIDVSQNLIQKLINLGHQINSVHEIDVSNNRISGWNNRNIFMMKISRRDESRLSEFVEKRMNISATYSSTGGLIPWASRVNLSNNLLTVFTSAMLTSLSALEEVDLGGNFINCGDCNTSHFQQWLASTRTTVKNLGTNTPLLCYTPWELKGRPIQEINFDEVCFIPRRYLWLGIGAPIAGVIAFVAIGGVIFYYRTEVVYLAHLAKVRATSKKKMQIQSLACYDAFVCYSNSVFKADIRDDLLSSPPFTHSPDDPLFWDFSSPLFSAEQGLLHSFSAEAESEEHYPTALPGLAGSSLTFIELTGSFGTDLNGPIPSLNNLPLLDGLVLTNSPMVDLPTEYLAHSGGITLLCLEKNKFHEVPKAIGELKNLTKLIFESLVEKFVFYPDILNRLPKLRSLTLSGTRIEHWTEKNVNFTRLKELNLSRCKMRSFNAAFSNFPELQILDLSENLLTFFSKNAFAGLGKLKSVNLSRNVISHLPGNLLISLYELETLSLAINNLTDWPKLPCNRFQTINVSNNQLSNLINLGQHIRAVNELDISNNKISEWKDRDIFIKEVTCKQKNTIHFKSLRKQYDPSPVLFGVPKLRISFVNISNNRIAIFSEEMVGSLTYLDTVDLEGNLIDCANCQTALLQRWLDSTEIKVENLGQKSPLQCHQPMDFKNRFVQSVNFEICFVPPRYLWLGIGAPTIGVISIVVIGSVLFYYRTEVVYLAHLAKVRSTSKKKQSDTHSSYDAFVCYSGKNRKWVMRRLVPLLERRPENYSLCLFDRDFALGSHIVTNIVDAIDQSRKVIVVLTQHFIDSKWCQWELEMAQHKLFSEDREFLVLLELEPLERRRLPRLLRFLLDTRPVVRWPRPETAPAVMAAAAELRAVLGPSLRQTLLADPPPRDEPGPSTSMADERTPLLADEQTQEN